MRITYDTGFTQMPNTILRSRVLKPLHKVVLGVICSYSNDSNIAFPSYQTIANDSGISRRKVIDIISELVNLGCIRKTERRSTKGDHTANDYEVLIGKAGFSLPGENSAPPGNENNSPQHHESLQDNNKAKLQIRKILLKYNIFSLLLFLIRQYIFH